MKTITKYELYSFKAKKYTDWWYILPAIEMHGQDYRYIHKTFDICLHFLCFHVQWMFWEVDRDI